MKLLFVEDEFYTRSGILQSIDRAGIGIDQVECASNGREKLSLCPDIPLTDIRMPYVTGLDIAKALKRNNPDAEVPPARWYLLLKPVRLGELTRALTQAVGRRRKLLMLRQLVRRPSFSSLPDAEHPRCRHSTRMALQLISQRYPEAQFNVNTLAEELHMTPVYLTTSFRRPLDAR